MGFVCATFPKVGSWESAGTEFPACNMLLKDILIVITSDAIFIFRLRYLVEPLKLSYVQSIYLKI